MIGDLVMFGLKRLFGAWAVPAGLAILVGLVSAGWGYVHHSIVAKRDMEWQMKLDKANVEATQKINAANFKASKAAADQRLADAEEGAKRADHEAKLQAAVDAIGADYAKLAKDGVCYPGAVVRAMRR